MSQREDFLLESSAVHYISAKLTNLSTQEARLRRQREKDTAALETLQSGRKAARNQKLNEAARLYMEAVAEETNQDWTPEQFGFEFSMEEVESRAIALQPDLFDAWYRQNSEDLAA